MIFSAEIVEGILSLRLQGNLIGDQSDFAITKTADEYINNNVLYAAVDISQIDYINSTGIGVLITLLTKFRNKEGEICLINPSDLVKKLLIITKLYAIFSISNSFEEALNYLNNELKLKEDRLRTKPA